MKEKNSMNFQNRVLGLVFLTTAAYGIVREEGGKQEFYAMGRN